MQLQTAAVINIEAEIDLHFNFHYEHRDLLCLSSDQFDDIRGWIMAPIHQKCRDSIHETFFWAPLALKPIYFSIFQRNVKVDPSAHLPNVP